MPRCDYNDEVRAREIAEERQIEQAEEATRMVDEPQNLLEAIPSGDMSSWLIGWRDWDTGEKGNDIVRAGHADEAVRGFERDNPRRRVLNVYQSPIE